MRIRQESASPEAAQACAGRPGEKPSRQGIVALQGTPSPRPALRAGRGVGHPVFSLCFYWFGLLVANPHEAGARFGDTRILCELQHMHTALRTLQNLGTLHLKKNGTYGGVFLWKKKISRFPAPARCEFTDVHA